MTGYWLLLPEVLLLAGVAWAMFAERLPGRDRGAVLVGAALALAASVVAALAPAGALFGELMVIDGPARFVRSGAAALLALWLVWTWARGEGRLREAVALALLATIGTISLATSRDLVTTVLSLELATIPAYVLIGYRRHRVSGLEGALKYFLLSMLTSLVMMYGMSFLYGVSGSTRFAELSVADAGTMGLLAVILTFVGLFAKLSAAPFHYWAPDAYEGAEPWTVAFVSVVPKLGGAIVLVRLTAALAESMPQLATFIAVAAGASMVLGNLAALNQEDIRRLMAYSGVAHAGYLMLGVAAMSERGYSAAILYALAYSVPSLGIMLVAAGEGARLGDLAGLASRRPAVAWATVAMLVSLIGIPPLVGFFGKLYLFLGALEAGLGPWVVVAVVMSAVSAAYYLRFVRAMFFAEPDGRDPVDAAAPTATGAIGDGVVVAAAAASLALGISAGWLLGALAG